MSEHYVYCTYCGEEGHLRVNCAWREAADERAVRAAAAEVYKPEGVDIWMNAMQMRFDGRTPLEAIADGDTDRVLQVLDQLASGAFG